MKKHNIIRYSDILSLCLFLIVVISTGLSWGEQVTSGPVDFTLEPMLSSEWACYMLDGNLYARNIKDAPLKVRGNKEASAVLLKPSCKVFNDSLFVSWIERRPGGNRLLFTALRGKEKTGVEIIELASQTKSTYSDVFTSGSERVYILDGSQEREPELFMNISLDGGKTFKRVPLEVKGPQFLYHPSPVVVGDTLYIFFFGIKERKNYFGVNTYEIPSIKMKKSVLLKETDSISFIEAFPFRDRPIALYKTLHNTTFVLEGFVKRDGAWETFSIKEAEGLDVARMDYHVWEDGRMLIVFSGEERGISKQRIYAAISKDAGKTWGVSRIDNKEFEYSRSWLPRLAVDRERVMIVWEDSRDIRSGIRIKLSPDRGKTWLKRDIPVSNNKYYALRPRISFGKDDFHIAYHQFRNDERKVADLVVMKLRWDEGVKMADEREKGLGLKEKEALLRERAGAYWKGMVEKDMKTTYELHDPFYRARIPFDVYAAHRGPMVYHSYSIEGTRIEGNVATVKVKITYEVPKMTILERETSFPKQEVSIDDTYLFIDSTWFKKFEDPISGGGAIDY